MINHIAGGFRFDDRCHSVGCHFHRAVLADLVESNLERMRR